MRVPSGHSLYLASANNANTMVGVCKEIVLLGRNIQGAHIFLRYCETIKDLYLLMT